MLPVHPGISCRGRPSHSPSPCSITGHHRGHRGLGRGSVGSGAARRDRVAEEHGDQLRADADHEPAGEIPRPSAPARPLPGDRESPGLRHARARRASARSRRDDHPRPEAQPLLRAAGNQGHRRDPGRRDVAFGRRDLDRGEGGQQPSEHSTQLHRLHQADPRRLDRAEPRRRAVDRQRPEGDPEQRLRGWSGLQQPLLRRIPGRPEARVHLQPGRGSGSRRR